MSGPRRVASLLPSGTEIVLALGLGDRLVGVTDECEVPPDRYPVVVRARRPPDLTAAAIDAWVGEHADDGLYDLVDDLLRRIAPDVVLTQDLCAVCAVPGTDVARAMQRVGCPAEVVTLRPTRLTDVLDDVVRVATALGETRRGRDLAAGLRARLGELRSPRRRPRVLVLEWLDPPYGAGHWIPDVVTAAGGDPVLATAGGRSGVLDWERAWRADPDVVVVSPCGPPAADAADADALLAAVPEPLRSRAVVVDGLTQPGPGLIAVAERLASIWA